MIRKDIFLQFLADNGLKIIWTCLGEKSIYGGSSRGQRYSKWLELSGVYTVNNGDISGQINTFIQSSI